MDSRFEDLYKYRALRYTMVQRSLNLNHQRRTSRNTLLNEVRQIPDILTPIASPTVMEPTPENPKKENRLELLKKWQEEKKKRQLEQKRNSKPRFKVCHVTNSSNFNLDNVYKEIKGKPIAPSSRYKFKPPANIKPVASKTVIQNNKGAIKKVAPIKPGAEAKKKNLHENNTQKLPEPRVTRSTSRELQAVLKSTKKTTVDSKAVAKTILPESTSGKGRSEETFKNIIGLVSKEQAQKNSIINVDSKGILKVSRNRDKSTEMIRSDLNLVPDKSPRKTRSNANVISKVSSRNTLQGSSKSKSKEENKRNSSVLKEQSQKSVRSHIDVDNILKSRRRNRSKEPSKSNLSLVSEESLTKTTRIRVDSKVSTRNKFKTSRSKSEESGESACSTIFEESSEPDTKLSFVNTSTELLSPGKLVTPVKADPPEVIYISPFVTISRGKENSRREYKKRSLAGGSMGNTSTSPQAAAVYFRDLLDSQIERLTILCHEWNVYKGEQQPPEEVCDMINVAIGQTDLLIRKKFQQFRGLVDSCERGNSEKLVTCLDLHGFWDMVMIQVNNLNKRFENLENLKMNNWEEILPIKITKPKPKKALIKKKSATGSSTLRAAIQEARKKKAEQKEPENGGFLSLKSPASGRKSRSRRSLRTSVLINNEAKRLESPNVKSASKDNTPLRKQGSTKTTPKSILKSEKSRKSRRLSKNVLFVNSNSDEENDINGLNYLIQFSPPSTPKLRKSLRFN